MQYRKISEIKKNDSNPRYIKKEDMDRLVDSLNKNKDYFEARPIILSDRTGELIIIAGNQRYEAAKIIGMKEVPTYLLSGLTEEREREIIVRDNISNGDWDWDVLANEYDKEELEEWGMDVDKWGDINFDDIKSTEDREAQFKEQTVTCPDCGKSFTIKV